MVAGFCAALCHGFPSRQAKNLPDKAAQLPFLTEASSPFVQAEKAFLPDKAYTPLSFFLQALIWAAGAKDACALRRGIATAMPTHADLLSLLGGQLEADVLPLVQRAAVARVDVRVDEEMDELQHVQEEVLAGKLLWRLGEMGRIRTHVATTLQT